MWDCLIGDLHKMRTPHAGWEANPVKPAEWLGCLPCTFSDAVIVGFHAPVQAEDWVSHVYGVPLDNLF